MPRATPAGRAEPTAESVAGLISVCLLGRSNRQSGRRRRAADQVERFLVSAEEFARNRIARPGVRPASRYRSPRFGRVTPGSRRRRSRPPVVQSGRRPARSRRGSRCGTPKAARTPIDTNRPRRSHRPGAGRSSIQSVRHAHEIASSATVTKSSAVLGNQVQENQE